MVAFEAKQNCTQTVHVHYSSYYLYDIRIVTNYQQYSRFHYDTAYILFHWTLYLQYIKLNFP